MFSCGLGIATLNYLDQLETHGDPTVEATHRITREKAQGWFRHSEFTASLEDAFKLWDAVSSIFKPQIMTRTHDEILQVYIGVKDARDLVGDRKLWDNTDQWLAQRR